MVAAAPCGREARHMKQVGVLRLEDWHARHIHSSGCLLVAWCPALGTDPPAAAAAAEASFGRPHRKQLERLAKLLMPQEHFQSPLSSWERARVACMCIGETRPAGAAGAATPECDGLALPGRAAMVNVPTPRRMARDISAVVDFMLR